MNEKVDRDAMSQAERINFDEMVQRWAEAEAEAVAPDTPGSTLADWADAVVDADEYENDTRQLAVEQIETVLCTTWLQVAKTVSDPRPQMTFGDEWVGGNPFGEENYAILTRDEDREGTFILAVYDGQNSLPAHQILTEHSPRFITLLKDFTWRPWS